MSRDISGAPTGAPVPSLADLAAQIRVEVVAAEKGHRSALGHAIRAGELLTEAKASPQMKHGQWLPWLEKNFPGTRNTATNYMRLAANEQHVVHLSSVRDALAEVTKINRESKPPNERPRPRQKTKAGTELWEDEDVLAWVKRCIKAGMTRDEIGAASRTGARGWPGPSSGLPQDAGARAAAVVRDRERRVDGGSRRPPPRESGKRMRAISTERKRDPKPIRDVQYDMMRMVGILEAIDLPAEGLGDADEYLVADVFDDFTRLKRWVDSSMDTVIAHMDEERRRAKLRTLRERAEDPSSTPNERAVAGSAADRLEARVNAARLAAVNGTESAA